MKRYLFLILAIIVSATVYFGAASVAEAATVTVVRDLGASYWSQGCNFGDGNTWTQFNVISGSLGLNLCKRFETFTYTPGTTQATVMDDVATAADCSSLGSGWIPYGLVGDSYPAGTLGGCKHLTTISYTPGTTNQTLLTDMYAGYTSDAAYAGGAGCSGATAGLGWSRYDANPGWLGWGWQGGISVGLCKKVQTLPLGTPTELPPLYTCNVPPLGATYTTPFSYNYSLPPGHYTVNNSNTPPGETPFFEVPVPGVSALFSGEAGVTYSGTNSNGCSWSFNVTGGGGAGTGGGGGGGGGGGTEGTNSVCANGATNPPTCTLGGNGSCLNSASNPPACTFTHYTANNNSWSACSGYDTQTGQGGTQTRSQATPLTYTNTTGPNDTSAPVLSQSCTMPPDFNFLSSISLLGVGGGILSNTYSTFVTFVGGQQSALSAPVSIAVSPTFSNYLGGLPNLTFSVTSSPLPSNVSYNFTPQPLLSSQYSQGTSFVINVPRVNPGVYTLTVEASGGGIVKQATVYLNVNVINPSFIEI